ncbi:MAG TPA: DUF1003 domain-containing protein [Bacteroidales bacterium]|nr:DUF1003 domain-containing protein [Bacteroidales bacterium]HPS71559.1 DUF1003 domain-containing protein [Bacteroidales bacterium]
MKNFLSDLSQKEFPISERVSATAIRHSVLQLIQEENPDFSESSFLSLSELNDYREKYITQSLKNELGDLSHLEENVLKTMKEKKTITDKGTIKASKNTFGQKVADKVASFGGSWTFILSFMGFIVIWIILNAILLTRKEFDPYPFILLNLILSCIASLQAPVIMMSQNRQEAKDRKRSQDDYMINLKSELEIRTLHEKIDHLIIHQQQEMMEVQKVQIEMLNDIMKEIQLLKAK